MNAIDMSQFTVAKSDQLNAEDFLGGARTFRIAAVTASGSPDQPVNVRLEGEERFFRPCKTMRRVMIAVWGNDSANYIGQAMTLYRDPKVTFGGMQTGGIRISHMSGISEDKLIVIMEKKGKKAGITIKPLATRPAAQAPRSPAGPATQPGTGEATHGDGAGASPNGPSDEETAEWTDWVMDALAGIAQCDRARLAKWQARKAGELAHLEEHFPKLHRDVLAAIADRNAALDGLPADGVGA